MTHELKTQHLWLGVLLCLFLCACGGGGGDAASSGSAAASTSALTFTPSTISVGAVAGTSSTITVWGTATQPANFSGAAVYATVVDKAGVLTSDIQISLSGAGAYTAVLHTSPSLAIGTYTGTFTVNVCRDSACASPLPGSPMQLPYNIVVVDTTSGLLDANAATSLTRTYYAGAPAPAPGTINVQAHGGPWTARTNANWIKLSKTAGDGDDVITVNFDTAAFGNFLGESQGIVSIRNNGGVETQFTVILKTFGPLAGTDPSSISLSAINGAGFIQPQYAFTLASTEFGNWSAASNAPWLLARTTVLQSDATLLASLVLDTGSSQLTSGNYNATLFLANDKGAQRQVPVNFTLLKATLGLSANNLTFGGTYGREFRAQSVRLDLNTSPVNWIWNWSGMPAWAGSNPSSGNVGNTGSDLLLYPNAAQAPSGTSSSTAYATVNINGETVSAPLTLTINKDSHKLLASEVGVAFSATPGWSRLTRTVTIKDNYGAASAWSAGSDRSWLSASRSGDTLTLTADPTALGNNTLNYATVTLLPGDSGVTAPETIRVALWKGASTPSTVTALNASYTQLVADPIRPLVYLSNGGGAIDIYNIYTGLQTGSVAGLGGATVSAMSAGPNGDHLYVHDATARAIVVIDLTTQAKSASFALSPLLYPADNPILAIRPNGVELLLGADGNVYLPASGRKVGALPLDRGGLTASSDGTRVFTQNTGLGHSAATAYGVDYSDMAGGVVFTRQNASSQLSSTMSNGQDLAVSGDGARLYNANASETSCLMQNPDDLAPIGYLQASSALAHAVAVAVGSDGRVYCAVGNSSLLDIGVHGIDGTRLLGFKFAGLDKAVLTRRMAVSGDGLMVMALTDDPKLFFVPVGP